MLCVTCHTESHNATSGAQFHPLSTNSTYVKTINTELAAALGSLDGWAEDVLDRERGRIRDLRAAWLAQAKTKFAALENDATRVASK